jgi:hypothetical protein
MQLPDRARLGAVGARRRRRSSQLVGGRLSVIATSLRVAAVIAGAPAQAAARRPVSLAMDHIARDSLDALLAVAELVAAVVNGVGARVGAAKRRTGPRYRRGSRRSSLTACRFGIPHWLIERATRNGRRRVCAAPAVAEHASERERRVA